MTPYRINKYSLIAVIVVLTTLQSCEKNPYKVLDNIYVGNWQVDTSQINVAISLNTGAISQYAAYIPFLKENYQDVRALLKEPISITIKNTTESDRHTGSYVFAFANGKQQSGIYKLAGNILYIDITCPDGQIITVPCQADGNRLQIFYSMPYMTSILWDYVEKNYPSQFGSLQKALSGIVFSMEGLGVYHTRTPYSDEQYGK